MPRNARTQHKSSAVNDTVVTQWINYGSAAQSLSGVKAESRARQRMAASTLAGAKRSYASQGVHLWHPPLIYWQPLGLPVAARGAGLVVAPSEACRGRQSARRDLQFIGWMFESVRREAALGKLSKLLAQKPSAHRTMVIQRRCGHAEFGRWFDARSI